jgi:predicted alpha/beta superfamily hydrolase
MYLPDMKIANYFSQRAFRNNSPMFGRLFSAANLFAYLAFAVAALGALSSPACAQTRASADTSTMPSEVSIPNTRRFEFTSKVNGHRYAISVSIPFIPVPAQGYAVLYVMDGNWYFGSASEATRDWNAPGVVVVGIGYPTDKAYVDEIFSKYASEAKAEKPDVPGFRAAPGMARDYDLTSPATDSELAAQGSAVKSELVGHVDDYLKMIETEVKPRIAAMVHIDPKNQALFGDSLGGLATLHALLVEPAAFRTFIIGSPSIWWANKAVLKDEPKFAAAVTSGKASPRVIVTMGSEESTAPNPVPASWKTTYAKLDADLKRARMVENGRDFVAFLKSVHGGPGYVVADYKPFDDLDHGAASWAALARGIPFAFVYDK